MITLEYYQNKLKPLGEELRTHLEAQKQGAWLEFGIFGILNVFSPISVFETMG